MSQQVIDNVQLFILGSFVVSLFVWPAKHRRAVLNRDRRAGCVAGGCLVPLPLFILVLFMADGLGGPLFWPLFAVELGMVGFAAGTFFYLCRRKPDV